jgi:hypothetical protein
MDGRDLAKDASIPLPPGGSGEFSIGYLVSHKGEVYAMLAEAKCAGATVTDWRCPPTRRRRLSDARADRHKRP